MIKSLIFMLLISIFSIECHSTEARFSSNRLIVKLKNGKRLPINKNILKLKLLFNNVYVAYSNDIFALEKALKNNPSVEYVERDYHAAKRDLAIVEKSYFTPMKITPASPFNDPEYQWSFDDANEYGISAYTAYLDPSRNAKQEIIVAVIDTGVDYTHEDLSDNIWVNKNEIPGNGIDDDHNGYIDDVHGINTLIRDRDGNATVDIMDGSFHGTHVSGIIGAKQNNGIGIAGVASNVKITGICKVCKISF